MDIIYDWNQKGHRLSPPLKRVEFHDETLRDGIQCPSVKDPPIEIKRDILRRLDALSIDNCNVGLPGAGARAIADSKALVETIRDEKLNITAGCAARTLANDITPIIEISQQTSMPVEVMTFLGSSPIRMLAEHWDEARLEKLTRNAVKMGVDEGLPVSFVTEDTVRSNPKTLHRIFCAAVEEGADRLILCDTVGHATPDGVFNLVQWTHDLLVGLGVRDKVRIDWHGHDDRGLSLVNAMYAIEAGCDRVHGTMLGIGERVGNTNLDLLMVNLKCAGVDMGDLTSLTELVHIVSEATGVEIPVNYPVFGRDAFRTGTGVHAAAVIKAESSGDQWLADAVYSGVPASWVGRRQAIEIGHQSGISNVKAWLAAREIDAPESLVNAIFEVAKKGNRLLEEHEVHEIIAAQG